MGVGRAAGQHGGCRAGSLNIWLEKHPGLGLGEGLGRLPGGDAQGDEYAQVFNPVGEMKRQTKQIKTQVRSKAWESLLMGDVFGVSLENTADPKTSCLFLLPSVVSCHSNGISVLLALPTTWSFGAIVSSSLCNIHSI